MACTHVANQPFSFLFLSRFVVSSREEEKTMVSHTRVYAPSLWFCLTQIENSTACMLICISSGPFCCHWVFVGRLCFGTDFYTRFPIEVTLRVHVFTERLCFSLCVCILRAVSLMLSPANSTHLLCIWHFMFTNHKMHSSCFTLNWHCLEPMSEREPQSCIDIQLCFESISW